MDILKEKIKENIKIYMSRRKHQKKCGKTTRTNFINFNYTTYIHKF